MEPQPYEGYFWQGKLVRLRPLKAEDAPKKWREWTDSQARLLLQYGMDLPPVSLETYTERIRESVDFKDTSHFISLAIDTLEGEFVGWINIHSRDEKNGTFDMGVSVFREYRRRGYAQDALRLVLRYMFDECRYHKCESECLAINAGSAGMLRSLGFVEEGRRRQSVYTGGEYHDRLLFGLLRDEFEANDRPRR